MRRAKPTNGPPMNEAVKQHEERLRHLEQLFRRYIAGEATVMQEIFDRMTEVSPSFAAQYKVMVTPTGNKQEVGVTIRARTPDEMKAFAAGEMV